MDRCTEIRDLLSLYLENDLDEERASLVQEHLGNCDECAGLAETLAEVIGVGGALEALEPPESLAVDLFGWACSSRRWTTKFRSTISNAFSPTSRAVRHAGEPGRISR